MAKKLLITGGAGFIGSSLIRYLIKNQIEVINIDKLTYAGHLSNLTSVSSSRLYHFYELDICDSVNIGVILEKHKPDGVIHLAAESHVDRSIDSSSSFIQTNIIGTHVLLEQSLKYWKNHNKPLGFRFHHVSTDEVFGSLDSQGYFHENSPYKPNSPYSATKASSDLLVRAWGNTYGLPYVISNCSNNYGPFQLPEKLIPHTIIRALKGMSLPLYGDGQQIRDWLFVDDHVRALWQIFLLGRESETYLIGGNQEKTNQEVVENICTILDEIYPSAKGPYIKQLCFVSDRPGHDRRYAIDSNKLKKELDWYPLESFERGIYKTVNWYIENEDWWQNILNYDLNLERIGEIC